MKLIKGELTQIEKILYLIMIVLLFHTTRGINITLYGTILLSLYTYLYLVYILMKVKSKNNSIEFTVRELVFVISFLLIPVVSLINLPINEFLIAFPRYFVLFPFMFFLLIYKQLSLSFIKLALKTICIFMAVSALSIIYQVINGPITFLADPSIRSGFDRYASLAGSLSAMGTIGSLAIIILLFDQKWLFNRFYKYSLLIIIALGMLLSLQKASVINLILCLILFLILNFNKRQLIYSFMTILSVSILSVLIYTLLESTFIGGYIDTIINYTLNQDNNRTSEDLINRLTDKPEKVFDYHNISIIDILLGIGFASLAGVMGLSHYPMAHNAYVDLLLSGGALHLLSYLYLCVYIIYKSFFSVSRTIYNKIIKKMYLSIIILSLINMLIGSGKFYQPVQGVILFIVLFTFDRVLKITN